VREHFKIVLKEVALVTAVGKSFRHETDQWNKS